MLADHVQLPWSKEEFAKIPQLFNRSLLDVVARSVTPPPISGDEFVSGSGTGVAPTFHGML